MMIHLRNESADGNGSAASRAEAHKNAHYARPGRVSFEERRHKLTTLLAVESFECLEKGGIEFFNQLTTGINGEWDSENLGRGSVPKERPNYFFPSPRRWLSPVGWSGMVWHWARDVKRVKVKPRTFLLITVGQKYVALHVPLTGVGLFGGVLRLSLVVFCHPLLFLAIIAIHIIYFWMISVCVLVVLWFFCRVIFFRSFCLPWQSRVPQEIISASSSVYIDIRHLY